MSSQTYSYQGRPPATNAMAARSYNSENYGDAERRSHGIRESKTTNLSSSDRESGMAAAGIAASSSSNPTYHYHYHGPAPNGNVEQMAFRSANGWVGGEDGSSSSKPPKSKKRHHSRHPHHHHKHSASGSLSFSDSESFMSEDRDSLSSSLDASPGHHHHHHHRHHSRQQPPNPPFLPPLPGHSTHLQNQEQQASLQRQIEQIQQQQRKLEKKQKKKAQKNAKRRRERRSSSALSSVDSITITRRVVRSAGNEEERGEDAPRGRKGSGTRMGGGLSPASSISSTFVSGGGAVAAGADGSDAMKKRKKKDRKKGKDKTHRKDEDEDDAEWKKKKKGGELGTEPQSGMTQHYSRHRRGSKGKRRSSSSIVMSAPETLSPSSSGSPLSNVVTTTTTLTMRVTPSPHLREEEEDSYDDDDDNTEDEKKKKKKKQNKKELRKMRQKAKKRPGSGGRRRSSGSQRKDGSGHRSNHHRHHHHRRHSHPSRSRSCSSSSWVVPSSSTTTPGNSQTISVHTDTSAVSSPSSPQSPTREARGADPSAPSSHPHRHHHHHHHKHRSSSSHSLSRHPSQEDLQRSSLTVDIHQSLGESANSSLQGDNANEKKKMDGGNEKSKRRRKGKKNKGKTADRAKGEERDSASRRGRHRGEEGGNSGRHHSRRRHRRCSAGSLLEEETTVTISKTELKPISTVLTSMDRLMNDPQLHSQANGGGGTDNRDPLTIVITKDQQDRRRQEHSKPSPTKSSSQVSSPRSYTIPITTAATSPSPPPAAGPGTPSHPGVQGQYVHDVDKEAANAQKMHNLKLKAACLAHEDFIFDLHAPSWAETQQEKLDAAHEKAANLLAALERGDKWQITEPFELSRLMRLCNLELSFQELNKPNDKPQYLEIMALRKALGELRQHPKKASGVSLAGTIDHALNKLERTEDELRRSQWNAAPLGRAALPIVKGLEDCLNAPLVERSLEANEDRIAAQLDAIKASTKLRDAALADGEMGIAEEQYYVKGQLLEHLLELIKDKFRILGENESRSDRMPSIEEARRRAANEIASIRNSNRRLQECCEDDLKNLIHAIHTADIADAEAAKEYVSKRDGSEQALENNLKRQSEKWTKIRELERGLQLLGEERMEEVKRRIDGHDREEKRHVEYQQFLDVCEQHKKVLELTIYNCEIGNRCAALIEEMISETCKSVQSRIEKMSEEIADLRLQVHIEYLEAFRRLYKTFGQLMYKKEKRMEEIDRQIRTTHIQLEFAIETFDPNAKKHSDAKKELHQLRAHVEGELELLKEKVSQALDNFAPTEDALNQAGIKFKHPVDEVEDINLSRRSKMVEYRAHLAKQEEERIKAEREEIKRAKKIHGDNQRSRGTLQIT